MRFRRTPNYRAGVPFDRPGTRRLPIYRGHGLVISAMLHLAVLVSLLSASFRPWHYEIYAAREARALYVATKLWNVGEPPELPSIDVSEQSEMADSVVKDRIQEQMAFAKQRSDQPKGLSSPAVFDVAAAQFHDIRRETNPAGSWRYVCILIDAQGYLFEVEMEAEDGRRLYETMQRIKQNPLLERVYRQVAMPLLDQLIHSAQPSSSLAVLRLIR